MNDYGNSAAMGGAIAGMLMTFFFVFLTIALFFVACLWKIYSKAGKPGWAAIIPIYNYIILLEIVGKPVWWIVLMFIPFANIIVAIVILIELAKSFGKSGGFAVGMLLLPVIFYPILAFGDSKYVGPGGISPVAVDPALAI
jgi:hypothetical protein